MREQIHMMTAIRRQHAVENDAEYGFGLFDVLKTTNAGRVEGRQVIAQRSGQGGDGICRPCGYERLEGVVQLTLEARIRLSLGKIEVTE
jgi:hypothetical protein